MNILLLATAWGPKHGGINAFNRDFSIGLAREIGANGRVFCTALGPTDHDIADAKRHGVGLIPIKGKAPRGEFDTSWTFEAVEWLKQHADNAEIDLWVGHDITTGEAALRGPSIGGGSTALIHHMSYVGYQAYKHDHSIEALAKHERQKRMFQSHAGLFAIGPLLRDSCRELSRRIPTQLVPGFAEIVQSDGPNDRIIAITYGRMDPESDRVKQGRLAVAGFGEAVRRANAATVKLRSLRRPRLYVIGLNAELQEEAAEIKSLADVRAGQATNVFALPFDEDRNHLFHRLAESNLAMMLSWHEGFGLTGWEAIAAQIPLIVSEHSGLYQLIHETLGGAGTGCVRSIDVQGRRGIETEFNFTDRDLVTVADEIVRVASDIVQYRLDAESLKKMLIAKLGCTWHDTAQQFLRALNSATVGNAVDLMQPRESIPEISANIHTQVVEHSDHFIIEIPYNAIPECAELILATNQGSTDTLFDLLPELRFGREEFEVDGVYVSYGIAEAALQVQLSECRIVHGKRLGDESHPCVEAKGNNTWRITGPKEGGILLRRALGADPICQVEADQLAKPAVTVTLSCRQRHVVYEQVDPGGPAISVTEARILEAFFNKCLGSDNGNVLLSQATMTTRDRKS